MQDRVWQTHSPHGFRTTQSWRADHMRGLKLQVIFRARHTTCEGAKTVRIVLSPSDFFKMEAGANCLRDQSPYHAPMHLHLDPAARQPEGRKLRTPAAFRAREY